MTTLRIGQACEFKPTAGLGGWRPGVVDGFVGRLISVRAGTVLHSVKPSHVRPAREETRPDRGAQQAAARAQTRGYLEAIKASSMDTEEPEEVIPRDVEPIATRAVYPGTGAARVPVFAPQPKAPKPTRSQAFLKWQRMQPCALTGETAEDAHHYENAGMGRKCSDFMTVPLTHSAHMTYHNRGFYAGMMAAALQRGETYETLATKLAMAEAGWRSLVAWLETKEGGEDE